MRTFLLSPEKNGFFRLRPLMDVQLQPDSFYFWPKNTHFAGLQKRQAKTSQKFIFSNNNRNVESSISSDVEFRASLKFSCFDIRLQNVYDDVWWSTPLINESPTFHRRKDFFSTSSRSAMPHGVDKSIETLNTFSHLAFGLTTSLAPLWGIRMQNYLGKDEKRK